ncbi:MAG: OadG family protein, partial [Nitrososphaerota archaeon]|nr:OadG family protein [Nitrososphaerota archaeon]
MRNRHHLFTTIGIMLLVIGTSFLVGTTYRSAFTLGVNTGSLPPGEDSPAFMGPFSLSPRNYAIKLELDYYDAQFNLNPLSSVDFYLLNSKGSERWLTEGIIEPVWFAKEVSPTDTLHMKIPHRGDYFFIVVTSDGSRITGYLRPSLSGYERDLLWFSVITIIVGLAITAVFKTKFQNKNTQPTSTNTGLKRNDNSIGGVILLSEKVVSSGSSAKVGGSRFGGSLRRLLVWELEECFAFPMLEVILICVVLTVLTPAVIEVSPSFSYNNLLSGIHTVFLFLIFIVGVLFCHSYAGGIYKKKKKMILSYPV